MWSANTSVSGATNSVAQYALSYTEKIIFILLRHKLWECMRLWEHANMYILQGIENFQLLKMLKFSGSKYVISITWISLVLQIKLDHGVIKHLFRYISVHMDSVQHLTKGRYSAWNESTHCLQKLSNFTCQKLVSPCIAQYA